MWKLLLTSARSNHTTTVKAEEGKGSRENLKYTFVQLFLKFTFPFEAFETYPQDVEGHHPSCAMDHLKTETDKELKRDVEKQM